MSGPVWRVHEGDTVVCHECLRESTRAFAEGEVADGEFQSERFLCEDCYPRQVSILMRMMWRISGGRLINRMIPPTIPAMQSSTASVIYDLFFIFLTESLYIESVCSTNLE